MVPSLSQLVVLRSARLGSYLVGTEARSEGRTRRQVGWLAVAIDALSTSSRCVIVKSDQTLKMSNWEFGSGIIFGIVSRCDILQVRKSGRHDYCQHFEDVIRGRAAVA
jgi:hypothetical protein